MRKNTRFRDQYLSKSWLLSDIISLKSFSNDSNSDQSFFSNKSIEKQQYNIQESWVSSLNENHLNEKRNKQDLSEYGEVENSSPDAYSFERQEMPQNPQEAQMKIVSETSKDSQAQSQRTKPKQQVQKPAHYNQNRRQFTNFIKVSMQKPFRQLQKQLSPEYMNQAKRFRLFNKVTTHKNLFDQILRTKIYSNYWETFYPILVAHLQSINNNKQAIIRDYCAKILRYSQYINQDRFEQAFKTQFKHEKRWMRQYKPFIARITKIRSTQPQQEQENISKMTSRSQKKIRKL